MKVTNNALGVPEGPEGWWKTTTEVARTRNVTTQRVRRVLAGNTAAILNAGSGYSVWLDPNDRGRVDEYLALDAIVRRAGFRATGPKPVGRR